VARFQKCWYAGKPPGTDSQPSAMRMQDMRVKPPGQPREPQSIEGSKAGGAAQQMHHHPCSLESRQQRTWPADSQMDVPTSVLHSLGQPEDMSLRPREAASMKDQKKT
jgi:hypothetical protein